MSNVLPPGSNPEFDRLRELTERIGADPALTQASTGNTSAKLEGELCIKQSGRWMSAAMQDDIFIRLNLSEVIECLRQGLDPGELFPGASLETAMHAVMPHRIVVHVHSVNAIAWAVRADGLSQIQSRLQGLRWQWIPYLPSGLPLARGIEQACQRRPDTDLFVLANHGLVVGGKDVRAVGALLDDVHQRLDIAPRSPWSADHEALADAGIAAVMDDGWRVPDDEAVHALATQSISQRIVSGGILYPCQAIFSGAEGVDAFRAIPQAAQRKYLRSSRPFLIVGKCGVLINRSASPAAIAMLSGLARVVQRLNASAPIRYLADDEVAGLSPEVAHRYCELAGAGSARSEASPVPGSWR